MDGWFGRIGRWMGAAANKNNHLKRHAIVRSEGSNIPVMLRDCFVFGLAEGEGALVPGQKRG